MASLLLKFGKKRNWDRLRLDWLRAGEVHADPLTDLRVSYGTLSAWWIDEAQSNLEIVLLALAASRNNLDKIDFGLFDVGIPLALGIPIEEDPADTPVARANGFHRNLLQLTTGKLAELVDALFTSIDRHRRLEGQVRALIMQQWGGNVELEKVRASLRREVEVALGDRGIAEG